MNAFDDGGLSEILTEILALYLVRILFFSH